MTVGFTQGHRVVGSAKLVGWDRWRFAAPAHHDFSMFFNGGPALEASWSHPTLKKAMALPKQRGSMRSGAVCTIPDVCSRFCPSHFEDSPPCDGLFPPSEFLP